LAARCSGDHGVGVDEFIVREERGEEEKKGAPWGAVSHRVAVYLHWHRGGAGGR